MISKPYQKRRIQFLEVFEQKGWKIKAYGISSEYRKCILEQLNLAKQNLPAWRAQTDKKLENYQIGTLILHQCKQGCFAVVNWWTDESMLQQYVYLADLENPGQFRRYSDGIISCVWELAVIWFERNAWVENVLANAGAPDFEKYLQQHLNTEI